MAIGTGIVELDRLRSAVRTLEQSLSAEKALLLEELNWPPDRLFFGGIRLAGDDKFVTIHKSALMLLDALQAPELAPDSPSELQMSIGSHEYYLLWERARRAVEYIEDMSVRAHIKLHYIQYALAGVVAMLKQEDMVRR